MKKLTVLISLILLAACSPKKSSVRSSANNSATTIAGTSTGLCASTANNAGTIAGGFDFDLNVKGLLSANLSSFEVGFVNAVKFTGLIKLDGSGNVVQDQSRLLISIYDSYYNQAQDNAIKLNFDPSKDTTKQSSITGQINLQSGDGTIILKDQFGEIRFQGRVDAQNFSGTVAYQNTVSVNGMNPSAGQLGQFQIQRCAILQ